MANEDGKLVIHDTQSSSPRKGEDIHHNAIFDLAWLAESFKLITVSGDRTARLVDIENDMQVTQIFMGHTRSVKTVATRDGDPSTFATGSRDGSIRVWDTRCATASVSHLVQPDRTIPNSHCRTTPTSSSKRKAAVSQAVTAANSVTSLVFQDDDKLISCGSGDGLIKVWDLRKTYISGKPTAMKEIAYSGHTTRNGFSNLLLDKSRQRLYANCLDNTIYAYNIATYHPQPVMEYKGHQNSTFYIKAALSSDGNYLLSGSSDQNAYIWNINNKYPIVRMVGHTAEVTCVAWRQDGETTVVTCSDDVKHKIWRIGPEYLPDNWSAEGRGAAECLSPVTTPTKSHQSLKRHLEVNENTPVQVKLPKMDVMKRELEGAASPEAKRFNSGRRLFALQEINEENECEHHADRHMRKATTSTAGTQGDLAVILEDTPDEESFKTPKASAIHKATAATTPEDTYSPTTNLPNFVVDGSAPHLHFSPQKRMPKDWLTNMRRERSLVKEMQDLAAGPSSPKVPRLEDQGYPNPTPSPSSRHKTPKRRNSRSGSAGASTSTGQSPILKFFRVSNSNILNNTQCSPKSPSLLTATNKMRTAEG